MDTRTFLVGHIVIATNLSLFSCRIVCGIGVTLIEPIFFLSFFSREKIYGYSDDFERSVQNICYLLHFFIMCFSKPLVFDKTKDMV